jgi:uncharacterized protein (UPF0276 family)
MLFAINYSEPAVALYQSGVIPLDCFKCPDWPGLIAEAQRICPVMVHFTLQAGDQTLAQADWELVQRLREQTDTPYVNLHLEPTPRAFPDIPIDSAEPHHLEQVVRGLVAEIAPVARMFTPEKVILENVPWRRHKGQVLRLGVEPLVIRRVVEETGCGLLLDISHARIAAQEMGLDERLYMLQLPTQRLRELHFTGLHLLNNRLKDHLEVLKTDWPFLEWVMERIRQQEWAQPWLLAFEYGGIGEKFTWRSDPQVIAAQVPRLYQYTKT